jgi:hypothetical protein
VLVLVLAVELEGATPPMPALEDDEPGPPPKPELDDRPGPDELVEEFVLELVLWLAVELELLEPQAPAAPTSRHPSVPATYNVFLIVSSVTVRS